MKDGWTDISSQLETEYNIRLTLPPQTLCNLSAIMSSLFDCISTTICQGPQPSHSCLRGKHILNKAMRNCVKITPLNGVEKKTYIYNIPEAIECENGFVQRWKEYAINLTTERMPHIAKFAHH